MQNPKTLQSYAKALLEILEDNDQASATLKELESVVSRLTPEWLALSENPAFQSGEKRQASEAIAKQLKLTTTTAAFVMLVVENRRLRQLPQIVAYFRRQLLARAGKKQLILRSAKPLSQPQKQAIIKAFNQEQTAELEVSEEIQPYLLGGVQAQIDSTVYDGTIRGRLNQMKSILMQG